MVLLILTEYRVLKLELILIRSFILLLLLYTLYAKLMYKLTNVKRYVWNIFL